MADYKRLQQQQFAKTSQRNNETRYWEKFVSATAASSLLAGELQDDPDASTTTPQTPTTPLQHYAKVTHLQFNPVNQRELACTASTRITMYDTGDMSARSIAPVQAIKQITRFKSTAYSGRYRPTDGKLMIGSNDQGMISVFDNSSRSVLRQLRNGHSAAVTVCQFDQHDITKAYSGSDDSTLALWDVQTETQLQQWSEWQSDYIRTIQQHPTVPHLIYAGSYDHSLCQYDIRQPTDEQPSLLVNHGQPIETSLIMNNGTIILTAGSNTIKVWDLLNSGKLLQTISGHQKTITSLAMDGSGSRLLSGGLDHYVKVYDTTTYEVTHSIQYTNPVMSLAINSNNTVLAVGLLDGTLDIRRRPLGVEKHEKILVAKAARAQRKLPGNTKRYFQRGGSMPPDDVEADIVVKRHRTKKLQPYDQLLRKFEYSAALDSVIATNRASLIYSLFNELIDRNALKLALSGRDEQSLAPIIAFINSYIIHPHYSTLLIDITHQLIDIYTAAIGQSPAIDELLMKLQHIISEEKATQYQLLGVQGQVSALLSTTAGNLSQTTIDVIEHQKLKQAKQLMNGSSDIELLPPAGQNGHADGSSSDASID